MIRITEASIGHEQNLLLVIDDAHPTPAQLMSEASQAFFVRAGAIYPGVRAPVPAAYRDHIRSLAERPIRQTFGGTGEVQINACSFSMVTQPAERLALNQQVPHTDSNDPLLLAFVHYLCREDHGGTLFFRHRATGFEQINETRAETYNGEVGKLLMRMANQGQQAAFATANAEYAVIERVDNVFNRMIVYSGTNLHSGDIRLPDELTTNPHTGRLTITGFLQL